MRSFGCPPYTCFLFKPPHILPSANDIVYTYAFFKSYKHENMRSVNKFTVHTFWAFYTQF